MTELDQMRESWQSRHRYSVIASDGSTQPWTDSTVATGLTWAEASAMCQRLEAAEDVARQSNGRTSWSGIVYFQQLEPCAAADCQCNARGGRKRKAKD